MSERDEETPPGACSPPPGTASGTWHRLTYKSAEIIQRWYGDEDQWVDLDTTSEKLAAEGWRYHSAVPEPEEVAALRRIVAALVKGGWGTALSEMLKSGFMVCNETSGEFFTTPLGRRALGVEG